MCLLANLLCFHVSSASPETLAATHACLPAVLLDHGSQQDIEAYHYTVSGNTPPPPRLLCVLCRGDQRPGGLVQHLFACSVCGVCRFSADVPAEILPKKEAVVIRALLPTAACHCHVYGASTLFTFGWYDEGECALTYWL